MEPRHLAAARAFAACAQQCNYFRFGPKGGLGDSFACRETALWHHSGLFACDVHGGEKNPWGRPLVEIRGAAELRELLAALAEAEAPDRGRLMVRATTAGDEVLKAEARLASVRSNPEASAADRERARLSLDRAEVARMNADAALEAVGGRCNLCIIPLDHPSQITHGA